MAHFSARAAASVDCVATRAFEGSNVGQCAKPTLAELWAACEPQLRRLAANLGIDLSQVDDVLNEVYLAARPNADGWTDCEHARRWLFRVTVNRCHLEHRRNRRLRAVRKAVGRLWRSSTAGETTLDRLADEEEREAIRDALDQLEIELRAPLVLRYFLDLDSMEIGAILGVSPSTIRGRLRQGRLRLAAALRKAGFGRDE